MHPNYARHVAKQLGRAARRQQENLAVDVILIDPLERQMAYMGWRRKEEKQWTLIGPVYCVRETEKALLVKFEGEETWVPKSMLHEEENEINEPGDSGMLVLPEWLAKEKGWVT